MTPSGVEHIRKIGKSKWRVYVTASMTPSGVEHMGEAVMNGAVINRDRLNDAVRR